MVKLIVLVPDYLRGTTCKQIADCGLLLWSKKAVLTVLIERISNFQIRCQSSVVTTSFIHNRKENASLRLI